MSRNAAGTLIFLIVVISTGVYWTVLKKPDTVQIKQKGSDTLLILAQSWAETYMAGHKDVEVIVSGGGSGAGVSALINRQVDMAGTSREIKQKEIVVAGENGVSPVEWKVAIDGISVIVNRANKVSELSYGQLKGLYTGEIRNWAVVGGDDAPIVTYGRQSTSGTYVYFAEEVLDGQDYRADMNQMSGNADIVEAVINDPNGIGYVGVAYSEARKDELNIVSVKLLEASQAYLPIVENIANGSYPISRYLYVYTDEKPEGEVKDYLRFILESEGQGIVKIEGYISLPVDIQNEQLNMLG